MKRGLFIGRFQPFHFGHLQDIKNAMKEVDELIIGIGSCNEEHTKENPFTVKERVDIINLVLADNKIKKYVSLPNSASEVKKYISEIVLLRHSKHT